jgi:hypothetical protein
MNSVKKARKGKQSMKKQRALSLFSGAGGMDIGVKKAGFDILSPKLNLTSSSTCF